jgi:hypothetical protein
MKKATPQSIGVWAVGAVVLVGYQIAVQRWPVVSGAERLGVTVVIATTYLSMNLMEQVPPRALLPSKLNSAGRNALNIMNFASGLGIAISFFYLSGLMARPSVGSTLFWAAIVGLVVGVALQLVFALVTPAGRAAES